METNKIENSQTWEITRESLYHLLMTYALLREEKLAKHRKINREQEENLAIEFAKVFLDQLEDQIIKRKEKESNGN